MAVPHGPIRRNPHNFDPPLVNQACNPVEILLVMLLEPVHQGAAGVERKLEVLEFLKDVQEGKVAVLVGLLDNGIKITNRLVVVNDEADAN